MKHAMSYAALSVIFLFIPVLLFSDDDIVTNTQDGGAGSLRQAIEDADTRPGPDVILFKIPKTDPGYDPTTGVWTIRPQTQLPPVDDGGLVIDGGSQKRFLGVDADQGGPIIEICGSASPDFNQGIYVRADSVAIIGLVINGFNGNGWSNGVHFERAKGGLVSRCYIGTDASGMKRRDNFYGISLDEESEGIEISDNIVSANRWGGISLGYGSKKCVFLRNTIGLNRDRSDTLGNGTGGGNYGGFFIQTACDSNIITDNWIGGNVMPGIELWGSSGNQILHNCIGTDTTLQKPLGNAGCGVYISTYSGDPQLPEHNRIQDNWIGHNGGAGVYFSGAGIRYNTIRRNRISGNGWGGIGSDQPLVQNIERPAIDACDGTSASGTAGPGWTVEVFNDETYQGRIYMGSTVADGSGRFSLTLLGPAPLPFVTATATDAEGSTSGLSQPFAVSQAVRGPVFVPTKDYLSPNYPNPFNPSTAMRFGVSKSERVRITAWNIRGELAAVLADGPFQPGVHGIVFDASELSAGIYVIRFETVGFSESRKITLVR